MSDNLSVQNEGLPSAMPPSRGWRIFWLVALLVSLPILIPVGFVLLIILHQQIASYIPRASVEMTITEIPATVSAIVYHDGSRYLDIAANGRRYLRQLPRPGNIFDLGSTSWFSTCVYRTARNEVAFNMWRYVEIIAKEPHRASVETLKDATYLGIFDAGTRGEIVFRPADPRRPAGPFSDRTRTAC